MWSEWRVVTKTATVGLHGNQYEVDARPDETTAPAAATGIDYLRLVQAQHTTELADRVRYSQLPDGHVPGQPMLPDTDTGQAPA